MTALRRVLAASIAAAFLVIGTGSIRLMAAGAPLVLSQPTCHVVTGNRYCIRVTTADVSAGVYKMRTITLTPSGAGSALVQFNGSGFCTNNSSSRGEVTFDTQIVAIGSATPNPTAPGGNTFSFTVEPISGPTPNGTHAFNLSAQRTFGVPSAAMQAYHFNLKFLRMDSNIDCDFYNLTFSIVYVPN